MAWPPLSPHRRFDRTAILDLRILGCRAGNENSVLKVFSVRKGVGDGWPRR